MVKKSSDRPDNFSESLERIEEKTEAPVLSNQQAGVIKSGYVDDADEVLALLEKSDRVHLKDLKKF